MGQCSILPPLSTNTDPCTKTTALHLLPRSWLCAEHTAYIVTRTPYLYCSNITRSVSWIGVVHSDSAARATKWSTQIKKQNEKNNNSKKRTNTNEILCALLLLLLARPRRRRCCCWCLRFNSLIVCSFFLSFLLSFIRSKRIFKPPTTF